MVLKKAEVKPIIGALSGVFQSLASVSLRDIFLVGEKKLPKHLRVSKIKVTDVAPKRNEKSGIFNAETPFVLVDIAGDDPTRGDTHGYIGVATRVAQKIGAKLRIIDYRTLSNLYPEIKRDRNLLHLAKRREAYFADEGYPDFFFTRRLSSSEDGLNAVASGIIVTSWNEELPSKLLSEFNKNRFNIIVPHHLTPALLAFEGQKFAQEFAELPRPFIGVNLADERYPQRLARKLGELTAVYEEATFFVCSCRRTPDDDYKGLMEELRTEFAGLQGKFPVVGFDYNFHAIHYEPADFWNPYQGMLDQADHIIQCGYSSSMISETLATGKLPYLSQTLDNHDGAERYVRYIFDHEAGKPLETACIEPVDITGECADQLIKTHAEHKALRANEEFMESVKTATSRYDTKGLTFKHFNPYLQSRDM